MAIVLRLSLNSSCSSSSSFSPLLLSSSSPLSNNTTTTTTTTQLGFSRKQKLDRRICSVLDSSSPSCSTAVAVAPLIFKQRKERSWKIQATVSETDEPKWWQRNTSPNMLDIHSTQDFLTALSEAGEKLVVAEFYGTWCGSCRALFPKLCKTAKENPDILFLKVDFDENKPMCKSLNVKVLPFFHFYRGADGQLDAFSCSLAKFQKIKDAIATHNTARCSIGPPKGVGDIILTGPSSSTIDKPAELSSR